MIEQEKTEQTIAQIIEDLEDLTIDCTCLGISKNECDKCFRRMVAKYIIEKEKESQKEILKKLFNAIKTSGKLFDTSDYLKLEFWAIDLDDIQEVIKQEFEVEVE